ncbi:MAG: PqqD family peptide modification chaperone [Candidatus Dormibacteraeota bacterium]|nr:PqqD family peptide modification chaperone [Candidatus Dormibacteraeota bacterium]
MLCPTCHVHTARSFPVCVKCGRPLSGASGQALVAAHLVAPDGGAGQALHVASTRIGRSAENEVTVSDGYVSRFHARIQRDNQGYAIEDLDSVNGTTVNGEALAPGQTRRLHDYDVIGLGPSSVLRLEYPRADELGSKTMIGAMDSVVMAGPATGQGSAPPVAPATPMDVRPRRRSGWALKRAPSAPGRERWVLRGASSAQYLQLTDRDVFLWNLMDGENTVRDLVLAYFQEYGQLAMNRVTQLLDQLAGAGLLHLGDSDGAAESTAAARLRQKVLHTLLKPEIAISGIDGFVGRLYQGFFWRFFTRTSLALAWGTAVAGLVAFFVAGRHQRPFDLGGAGVLGALVALGGYSAALLIHELAHALAVKSYGRRVPRGGFMLMLGMPYAFVDTTDMWLEAKGPRIVVTLAGPLSTLSVASVFSAVALLGPGRVLPAIAFQVAVGLYVNTLFNFNPLIPLDGYYALSDWLEMPRLREEAGAYFRTGIWRDLAHPRSLRPAHLGLALYGMLAIVGTFGFLLMGVFMWRARLGGMASQYIPRPFDAVAMYGALVLLFFPIWFAPLMKFRTRLSRRGRPEVKEVDGGTRSVSTA